MMLILRSFSLACSSEMGMDVFRGSDENVHPHPEWTLDVSSIRLTHVCHSLK